MTRLTLFLDWLDSAAGGLIRVAYLLAGVTAVAVYFGAGNLPPQLEVPLNAALPWALSVAVELHTYISARRVRAAWQEKDAGALKVNLGILAGLLAFSAWNQLGYLSETWHPPTSGALALPEPVAYLVRALVVPAAFMAAAFLAPMAEPITAQIEAEARATLADVFTIARKQRQRLLKEAERSGRDMTGALVELVPDPETRRIISHAYASIGAPIALQVAPQTAADTAHVVEATPAPPQRVLDGLEHPAEQPEDPPPTGPGSPAARVGASKRRKAQSKRPAVIRLQTPARPAARERIRAYLEAHPKASVRTIARRCGVSESTASKHRALYLQEHIQPQGQSGSEIAQ